MKNRLGLAWLRRLSYIVLSSGMASGIVGCKTRGLHESATKNSDAPAGLVRYEDFCSSTARPGDEPVQFWNRRTIETEIDAWHDMVKAASNAPALKAIFTDERPKDASPLFRASTVLVSYATAYKEMTAERDRARCDPTSKMRSIDNQVNMINHALADLMTRNIVNISRQCLLRDAESGGYGSEPLNGRWEFCDLYFDAAGPSRRYTNSMTVAMSSTMIYLTSHISAALSALPFMDRLWVGTEYARKGNDSKWQQRIAFIEKDYRPAFNAFNEFLSVNLDTVSQALYKESRDTSSKYALLRGPEIKDISKAIEKDFPALTAMIEKAFTIIRQESFERGMEMAENLAKNQASRDSLAGIMKTGNNFPEIHPFLVAKPLKGSDGDFYYDIRMDAPRFDERLLDFPSVRKVRQMTWKYRLLVESFTARTFFRSLGAISYAQGFNESSRSEGRVLAKVASCALGLAGKFSKTVRAEVEKRQDRALLANFEKKFAAARVSNDTGKLPSAQEELHSAIQAPPAASGPGNPDECDLPEQ